MRNLIKIISLTSLPLVAVNLTTAQTLLVDFANASSFRSLSSPGNWNSVGTGFAGNLIDSTGAATTVDFAPDGIGNSDSFNGPGYSNQYTGWDFGGDTGLQDAAIDSVRDETDGVIDKPALGDLGVAEAAMDFYSSTQGRFQIQQVTDGQAYDFTFFSSKKFPAGGETQTTFNVYDDSGYSNLLGSATLTHGSGGTPNTDTVATISNLIGPSNANNIFYIEYEGAGVGTTGYINSLSIIAVPEPGTYALMTAVAAFLLVAIRRCKV